MYMQSRNTHIFIVILLALIVGFGIARLTQQRSAPVAPAPITQTPLEIPNNATQLSQVSCPGFTVSSPLSNQQVSFPLTITGTVHPMNNPGPWAVFEGQAGTVWITDMQGNPLSTQKPISLTVDWMNTNPKPFSVTIPALTQSTVGNAILQFKDGNQADESERPSSYCQVSIQL